MKKKILFLTILLVFALIVLSACTSLSATLDEITKLIKADYSEVMLNIETVSPEVTLTGVYNFKFVGDTTTVTYTVEKLNELSMSGGNEGFKHTETGTAVVSKDKLVEGDTELDLPQGTYFGGMNFKPAFFKNYQITSVKFEADVVNPQGFTGNKTLQCSKMHVKVLHKDNVLTQLIITYVAQNGSDVSIIYLFTK